ncbi:Alkanesulfonates transport system permease protein [Rhodovastum atsumiense]|uniref:ABC transporter permease n=1 Tax=Rhodovastum atsumiense TaxID=504468 RepID=A0A5M6IJY0_9PROT|nr:ABC transporter permease [Rhodovastum atsumiense]KAA5608573.1 ABC transporter permease [Rhodovastum atsumiense]CAH2598787.1 Alkanesulfonates transport system permease protein [Rhodovastum atsumiense]
MRIALSPAFGPAPWRIPRLSWHGTGLLVPLGLLVIWQVASARTWLPPQILPSPLEVWQSGVDLWRSGDLELHVLTSLQRVLVGFTIGAAIGLSLGLAMGLSRRVEAYLRPLFIAISQVPALGWIPFLMLIVGIGEPLKIIVIAKAACVPMVLNTHAGIRNIPPAYLEVAQALRFTRWQLLRRLVLPATIPPVFTGVRYGLTHAWMALVAVELLASSEGLGFLLVWGRQMFWFDTVVMAMVLIGLVGFLLDLVLTRLERRLQRWRIADGTAGAVP